MISIALIALALGLSNFAASISMGLSGVDNRLRREIIVTFGFFEAVMPVLGLVMGRRIAGLIGSSAPYIGGGLLALTGLYALVHARWGNNEEVPTSRRRGSLIVTAAALSIDNLVVGFALGVYKVPLVVAALSIAVVSVGLSLLGLEIGGRLGPSVGPWSSEFGGAVLIAVGAGVAFGVL